MNLERMVRDAGQIFEGTVVESRTGTRDPATNLLVTYVTFDVHEDFYGANGSRVTIKQYGGEADGMAFYPKDVPRYVKGERVIMLLYGPSDIGMQSPIGLSQGRFLIRTNQADGHKTILSTAPEQQLFRGMNQSQALATNVMNRGSDDSLDYDEFRHTLRGLIATQKH